MKLFSAVPSRKSLDVARVQLEHDLRAKSQIARFGLLAPCESASQQVLPALPKIEFAPAPVAATCDHIGTGREPQARLFAPGFNDVCSHCGAVTERR